MRSLPYLRTRLAAAVSLAALFVLVASCGSRTGLFGTNLDDPDGSLRRDTGLDGPVPCIPGKFDFELAATQLMLIVDRSGSMAYSLDGKPPEDFLPGEKSRWDTLRDALQQQLSPFDQQIAFGAKFFPEVLSQSDLTDPDLSCRTDTGVGIAPKRGNAASIVNVFNTTEPRGGTPTSEAIRLGAQYLASSRAVARTMIVATDGAPNCNEALDYRTCTCTALATPCSSSERGRYSCLDNTRTVGVIRDAFEKQQIPVYVIGIGSTERPEFLRVLDDMAVAGGRPRSSTPRHYNVQSGDELGEALSEIRDQVSRCTYLTPSAPVDPNAISVEINGVVIQRDPTRTNGWDWVDQSFGEIAFFGNACELVSGGGSKASGVITCEPDR